MWDGTEMQKQRAVGRNQMEWVVLLKVNQNFCDSLGFPVKLLRYLRYILELLGIFFQLRFGEDTFLNKKLQSISLQAHV